MKWKAPIMHFLMHRHEVHSHGCRRPTFIRFRGNRRQALRLGEQVRVGYRDPASSRVASAEAMARPSPSASSGMTGARQVPRLLVLYIGGFAITGTSQVAG